MTEFTDNPPTPGAGAAGASGASAESEPPPAPAASQGSPPPPPPPPPQGAFAARYGLIRPRSGRYLAGVSGALARATNTDPVLWRVLFVVLAFFGGFGVMAYLILWLCTPADGDTASPVEAVFGRGRSATSTTLTVIVGVVTLLIVFGSSDGWPGSWALVALAAVAAAVFFAVNGRRQPPLQPVQPMAYQPDPGPGSPHPAAGSTQTTAPIPVGYQPAFSPHGPYAPTPAPLRVPPVPKPPKEHSKLGGLILSVGLVVLGTMGLLDAAGTYDIPVSGYVAAALTVVGLGLVLGAVLGRARGMVFVGLGLILALSATSFGDRDNFNLKQARGGGGEITWAPPALDALKGDYEHQFGSATLDLSQLDFTDVERTVRVRIQWGDLHVIVPPNVDITSASDVHIGSVTVLDRNANGVRVNDFEVSDLGEDGKAGGGTLHLELEVSMADAEVTR